MPPTLDPSDVPTGPRRRPRRGDHRDGGVAVQTLRACYAGPPDRAGLVLGYGGLGLAEIERGAGILVAAIRREARRGAATAAIR